MPPIQYPRQEHPLMLQNWLLIANSAKLAAHCKFRYPICEPPICNPKTLHHLRPKPKEKKICAAAMDVITQSSPCLSSDIKPRKIALVDVIMQAWPTVAWTWQESGDSKYRTQEVHNLSFMLAFLKILIIFWKTRTVAVKKLLLLLLQEAFHNFHAWLHHISPPNLHPPLLLSFLDMIIWRHHHHLPKALSRINSF